ncbi:MAG: TrkH family potassium uptake protein [Chloroflexota bacterium]
MRQRQYLRERYRALFSYIGLIVAVIGIVQLIPLILLVFYPDEVSYAPSFLSVGLPVLLIGLLSWRLLKPKQDVSVTLQEGFVVVLLVWLIAMITGAIPIMLIADLSFTQALFESTSGWTTTGLSVVDVTDVPNILLFYRSVIQFAGGAGLAILALSAITGPIGASVSAAEGRSDQLAPHVRQSLQIVLQLYTAYIVLGILSYWLAGMSLFDAVNHTFAAVSTGGFSTRPESIGYWDSPLIEAITIVLMFAGTINFLVAYTVIKGKWRAVIRHGEIRLMAIFIPLVSVLLVAFVTIGLYPTASKAIRVGIFETISALSTTGFSTVGYGDWSQFGWFLLIMLMFVGGGTGSTAGGIKQFRIYILYKAVVWEIKRSFLPPSTVNQPQLWYGDGYQSITDNVVRRSSIFVGFYVFFFLIGSGIMVAHGYSIGESFFEFASTLSTVGLSVGVTSPTAPDGVLWGQIFGMLLGRLEFFAVVIGLLKIGQDTAKMVA